MSADIRALGAAVAATIVLALAVLGAAAGGSWELEERDFSFGEPSAPADPEALDLPDPIEAPELPPSSEPADLRWVGTAGRILALTAAALLAWRLLDWLRRRRRERGLRRPHRADQLVPTEVTEPDLPVLQRGVEEAQRFLATIGAPADAVVAAWVALEEAAAASGVWRAPAQTPTEFTVAVLERTPADSAATSALLALYHRARFSRRPVGAAEVAAAGRCLAALAGSFAGSATAHRSRS